MGHWSHAAGNATKPVFSQFRLPLKVLSKRGKDRKMPVKWI